jgi:hypothetical protein
MFEDSKLPAVLGEEPDDRKQLSMQLRLNESHCSAL